MARVVYPIRLMATLDVQNLIIELPLLPMPPHSHSPQPNHAPEPDRPQRTPWRAAHTAAFPFPLAL